MKKQQAELEEYERKMKGRKRRPQKEAKEEENLSFVQKNKKLLFISITVAILAVFAFYLLSQ
jgi:hypothetical protein